MKTIKLWLAKKMLSLIRIEWRKEPIQGYPEIRVFFGETQRLLLKANYNIANNNWDFEEFV